MTDSPCTHHHAEIPRNHGGARRASRGGMSSSLPMLSESREKRSCGGSKS